MQTTYLTTEEVADLLRLKRRTVQMKIRDGQLDAANVGTVGKPSYRVTQEAIDRYLASRTAA